MTNEYQFDENMSRNTIAIIKKAFKQIVPSVQPADDTSVRYRRAEKKFAVKVFAPFHSEAHALKSSVTIHMTQYEATMWVIYGQQIIEIQTLSEKIEQKKKPNQV